jgi:hypothetical protein
VRIFKRVFSMSFEFLAITVSFILAFVFGIAAIEADKIREENSL